MSLLHFIDPGKPAQNAWIESFNARVRDEFLNVQVFRTLPQIRDDADSGSSTTTKFDRIRRLTILRPRNSSKTFLHQSHNRRRTKKWAQTQPNQIAGLAQVVREGGSSVGREPAIEKVQRPQKLRGSPGDARSKKPCVRGRNEVPKAETRFRAGSKPVHRQPRPFGTDRKDFSRYRTCFCPRGSSVYWRGVWCRADVGR